MLRTRDNCYRGRSSASCVYELERETSDASWSFGNASCSCPRCKLRMDGAEAEFI
ncbi:hypothetical protein DY000_02054343 [Brassica cretica]|uniref:Uncharacterized protein n=1 Tax=Brassica cretica TaxID=69181 RepID=A0ABQ7A6Z6_BRACR|nr:hypothetical protein DY000_02054343 [Brassica cretica]